MVLIREGTDAQTLGVIYVSVLQAVMLYGSDKWLTTPWFGRVLGLFHHRVTLRMTVRQSQRKQDGEWVYPPLDVAITEAVLMEVET